MQSDAKVITIGEPPDDRKFVVPLFIFVVY